KADESQGGLLASFFARWSRDPAAKLCLRRATLILRAQYAPRLSLARGSDSARRPAWGPQLASFLALSPPKLRLHLFCPWRGESGSLFCGRSERDRKNGPKQHGIAEPHPGMCGPHHCPGRGTSAPDSEILRSLP